MDKQVEDAKFLTKEVGRVKALGPRMLEVTIEDGVGPMTFTLSRSLATTLAVRLTMALGGGLKQEAP